jgi:hypothetical protein
LIARNAAISFIATKAAIRNLALDLRGTSIRVKSEALRA